MQQNTNYLNKILIGAAVLLGGLFVASRIHARIQAAQPVAPEIAVNNYIFEDHPTWSGDTATIEITNYRNIYVRVQPEAAANGLEVLINNEAKESNCASEYFCYKISAAEAEAKGGDFTVVATNPAGQSTAHIKVALKEKSSNNSGSETPADSKTSSAAPANSTGPSPASSGSSNSNSSGASSSNSSSSGTSSSSSVIKNSCLHYEQGRCWDDLEEEAYSAGLYDSRYGGYGWSFGYDDDCDAVCQEILEDAYYEGFEDY